MRPACRPILIRNLLFLSVLLSYLLPFLCLPASAAEYKPLIAINADARGKKPTVYSIEEPYVRAIERAGGIPLVIPPMSSESLERVLDRVDGVVMIGGRDYPPSLYGQKKHKSVVKMHEQRTAFDMSMADSVIKNEKLPFLGICAGAQAFNIRSGGTLVQDIPSHFSDSRIMHASPSGWQKGFNKHSITLDNDSKVARIYGKKKMTIVTSHHQCVGKVGRGLRVSARASDGVTECIESTGDRFLVGVQWHPERDFENNKCLFDELIKQSRKYRLARSK